MHTQHTPGPWTVKVTQRSYRSIVGADGNDVCEILGRLTNCRDDMGNAQLLSAAPDLLATLQMIASMSGWPASGQQAHPQTDLDHLTRYTAIRQHARAAIARATGAQS